MSLASVKVAVVTWNVGNEEPFGGEQSDELQHFFPTGFDVVVVGTQECSYKSGEKADGDDDDEEEKQQSVEQRQEARQGPRSSKWKDFTTKHFDRVLTQHATGQDMRCVKVASLLQMRVLVFASAHAAKLITSVKVDREATGLASVVGNKGGIAVCLTLQGTRLAFLSSHLAAHLHQVHHRNEDVQEILEGTRMFGRALDLYHQCDHLFWLGDLNYRIDLDYKPGAKPEKLKVGEDKHKANHATIKGLVGANDVAALLKHDQLLLERARGAVFANFEEQAIGFLPTFKVRRLREMTPEQKAEQNSYKEQRMPSFCDRVLWTSLPGVKANVTPLAYTSLPNVTSSDHKPVRAEFELKLEQPPARASRPNHNHQLAFTNVRCEGDGFQGRAGFYLKFDAYPAGLVSQFFTPPQDAPKWDAPSNLRLKVAADLDPAALAQVHVVVSVLDDRIGRDESLGSAALSVAQVMANNGTLEFAVPLVRASVATGVVLKGSVAIVEPSHKQWLAKDKRKKTRSWKQVV